ncbi:hypothetical protein HNP24_000245 [Chryseobacterium sediminis]|uniref:Uncharacterized protein n=1 Tax=Chryseobacterium sediminis TaxID=1679494 RepID=A0ABR6PUB8_9FLAO|nr:hypothetical protein [Chryseobacterium sediminis]MBB6329295.1 hypothetical protein [Chryseobacterium sediminis]
MKNFILIFFGLLLFDLIYVFVYDQFLIGIRPDFLSYLLALIKVLVNSPAVLFNKLLPFYADIPTYQAVLLLIGNVLIQTFLVYRVFFKNKRAS